MKAVSFMVTYKMCGNVSILLPDTIDPNNEEEVKKFVLQKIAEEDLPDPENEEWIGETELSKYDPDLEVYDVEDDDYLVEEERERKAYDDFVSKMKPVGGCKFEWTGEGSPMDFLRSMK